MSIYEKEPVAIDKQLESEKAALGDAWTAACTSCISETQACAILGHQQALLNANLRGSLRDVGLWIENGDLSSLVAHCANAVGLLIAKSNLRRLQTALPRLGDMFEPRLGRYGMFQELRCNDFLYLESYYADAIATCCLTNNFEVQTAGHAYTDFVRGLKDLGELVVVFDFETLVDFRTRHVFSEHQSVFRVVDHNIGKGERPEDDWAYLTLDRSPTLATGRLPVQKTNKGLTPDTAVFTLGHPRGMPMRYGLAEAIQPEPQCSNAYRAFVEAYSVASGSPMFRADDCTLTGILTRACSETSLDGRVRTNNKYVSTVCTPQSGCQGSLFIGLP